MRSPVSVQPEGLWVIAGLQGLSQTSEGSRTGWGRGAARWLLECREPPLCSQSPLLVASQRQMLLYSEQLLETVAAHVGRAVCPACACGRGAPGLLGPPGAGRQQLDLAQSGVCGVQGPYRSFTGGQAGPGGEVLETWDGLMWSPPSRSP